MESRESNSPENDNYAATVPLEISQDVASRADDLLREFAEDSGLETALIVDRSGALVAGISAEEEVTVDVISALVAGASGAMRALVSRLGETGAMESLHLGGDRLVYLREIVNRFILVGVSDTTRTAGLVRSKAQHIEGELTELLRDIRPVEVPLPASTGKASRSVREVALRRAAERLLESESLEPGSDVVLSEEESETIPVPAPKSHTESPGDAFILGEKEEEALEMEPIFESEPLVEFGALSSLDETPAPEPREVLEPLDFGEPEIVIEPSTPLSGVGEKVAPSVDSPFEVEREVAGNGKEETPPFLPPSGSVFELEAEMNDHEDADEEPEPDEEAELFEEPPVSDPASHPVFIEFQEEEDNEHSKNDEREAGEAVPPFFEFDGTEVGVRGNAEESDEPKSDISAVEEAFESFLEAADAETEEEGESEDGTADFTEKPREMIEEEEEDSEVRSSGPFYF